MSGDQPARFLQRSPGIELGIGLGIDENQYRWASSAESCAQNAVLPLEFLQSGQQRAERGAIGLVDAVFERGGQKFGSALRESREQEHGILHVRDCVGARILCGQNPTSLFGREALLGDGEQQRPLPFRADANHLGFDLASRLAGHASDGEATHPAGGGVVGVVLPAGGLADDLRIGPPQTPKVYCHGNACQPGGSRRATAFADGDVVRDAEVQRRDLPTSSLKHLAIRVQDEVVFWTSANFPVASAGGDGECLGCAGVELDVEIHGERRSVEGRT